MFGLLLISAEKCIPETELSFTSFLKIKKSEKLKISTFLRWCITMPNVYNHSDILVILHKCDCCN